MLSFSAYESDNRVMRYAESLVQRGDTVDVGALKTNSSQPDTETLGGVRVYRLQERSRKDQKTKGAYLLPILKFWLISSFWLARKHFQKPYDLIHVHNVPDFLVLAAWLPRVTGAKIILDIHDIVPEFYASKFHLDANSLGVKLLKQAERISASFAHHVIISNHLWRDKFVARSAPGRKCSVFVNHVDRKVFYRRERTRKDNKFVMLFPGGLQWHQGLDIAIRAFANVEKEAPHAEFLIYGDGNMREELIALSLSLGLGGKVRFPPGLPVREIAQVMANADLGVVPKRADSFGNEAYSTKIMEFMALGIPTIVSSTKIDRFYFDDTVVQFFESGNVEALAKAMLGFIRDRDLGRRISAAALDYVTRNDWDSYRANYLNLVDCLISENQPAMDLPADPLGQRPSGLVRATQPKVSDLQIK